MNDGVKVQFGRGSSDQANLLGESERGMVSSINSAEGGMMQTNFLGESECCCPLSVDLFRPVWPQPRTSVM